MARIDIPQDIVNPPRRMGRAQRCQKKTVRLRHPSRLGLRHYRQDLPEIVVDELKNSEITFTLHGMYGIEILGEIEYQHREGERCSQAYLN